MLPPYFTVPTLLVLSIALCWGAQYAARGNDAARAYEANRSQASFVADVVCDFAFSVLGGAVLLVFSAYFDVVTGTANALLGTFLLIALALGAVVLLERRTLTGRLEMYARKITYRAVLLLAFFVAALALVHAGVLQTVDG